MPFNTDLIKTAQEWSFGIILDSKLIFKCHIDKVLTKTSKSISFIKRLWNFSPRKSLITICKAIITLYLDYGGIQYDQPNKATFCQKNESVQYKTALAITGAIQGKSQEKRLDELDLETRRATRIFDTIRPFFPQNQGTFFNFQKRKGKASHLHPFPLH